MQRLGQDPGRQSQRRPEPGVLGAEPVLPAPIRDAGKAAGAAEGAGRGAEPVWRWFRGAAWGRRGGKRFAAAARRCRGRCTAHSESGRSNFSSGRCRAEIKPHGTAIAGIRVVNEAPGQGGHGADVRSSSRVQGGLDQAFCSYLICFRSSFELPFPLSHHAYTNSSTKLE